MLPDAWIEKLFQKFEDWYGAKWAAQYGDFPRDRVKRTWAEELGGFANIDGSIARALDAQKSSQFPPTLPEFIALCRDASRAIGTASKPALPYKPTAEDVAHQREMSKRLGDAIGAGKLKDGIDAHWATHPRNAMQLGMIFDAAKRDPRFQPCIARLCRYDRRAIDRRCEGCLRSTDEAYLRANSLWVPGASHVDGNHDRK